MKNKTILSKVTTALTKHPKLRDDDRSLCVQIWKSEIKGSDFMEAYKSGKLSNAETIRRARQFVQEINPGFRGLKYKQRHKRAAVVKKAIVKSKK